MSRRWREGVHIWCVECGRDLHWAPPEFVARHPMPRCWSCASLGLRKELYPGGPVAVTRAQALPAAPVQRRRWRWFR